MFEHKTSKVISVNRFVRRQLKYIAYALCIIAFSLSIGVVGYHHFSDLNWIDSLLNASMILGGMGPVDILTNDAAKLFASFYSLYSGIVFLATIAVMTAPALHRLMHILHLENGREDQL
ncbi:MAG: hypothetical protein NT150_02980 [Bacteroidetes bacterium]|nr:hypothetical protein [Bacteroidota bacterium]